MLEFAKSARHAEVLEGIAAARAAGFWHLKLNTVVIRGYNDDELADLLEFARAHEAEIRFIEYMDVGGATLWSMDQVVSAAGDHSNAVAAVRQDRAAARARIGTRPIDSRCRTARPSA